MIRRWEWTLIGIGAIVFLLILIESMSDDLQESTSASVPTWTSTPERQLLVAEPTEQPTATQTPEPTSTPAPLGRLVVNVPSANLRTGPGTDYEIASTAEQGRIFTVYDINTNETGEWWKLDQSGTVWIAAEIAAFQGRAPGLNPSMAHVVCEELVQNQLKAPSTAKFSRENSSETTYYIGNGRYQVQSWVDAQNSFGAQIRTDYVCVVENTGDDNYRLVDLRTSP